MWRSASVIYPLVWRLGKGIDSLVYGVTNNNHPEDLLLHSCDQTLISMEREHPPSLPGGGPLVKATTANSPKSRGNTEVPSSIRMNYMVYELASEPSPLIYSDEPCGL